MAYKAKTIRNMWDQVFLHADKLKDRVHKLLVLTLEHYKGPGNGDLSLFDYAINGLHKRGVHRRAAIQWVQRHAKATMTIVDGKVKFVKKDKADHTTVDVDKANASPFYDDEATDGRTGDDLKSFNLFGRIRSAIKKQKEIAEAIANNDGDMKKAGYDPEKTVIYDPEIVAKLEEFVEIYGKLDKPQPKLDRALFDRIQAVNEAELRQVG